MERTLQLTEVRRNEAYPRNTKIRKRATKGKRPRLILVCVGVRCQLSLMKHFTNADDRPTEKPRPQRIASGKAEGLQKDTIQRVACFGLLPPVSRSTHEADNIVSDVDRTPIPRKEVDCGIETWNNPVRHKQATLGAA